MSEETEPTLDPEDAAEAEPPEAVDSENGEEVVEEEALPESDSSSNDVTDGSQVYAMIALETDGLDVDEALAAVASLNELVMEQTPADAEAGARAEAAERSEPSYHPESEFPAPPMITLRRGQMASVVPALLLIIIGAWLTLALTTSESTPPSNLVVAIIIGGTGLALVAQGLASDRWSRGALFFGAGMMFTAGVFLFLSQPGGLGLADGWPLFIVAFGAAFVLTEILSPLSNPRLLLIGIMAAAGGLVALAVTMGTLPDALVQTIGNLWPVVVVALLVIWGLPVILRGRK